MKTIATVVGARPQFIKAAALSRKLKDHFYEIIIHTGQHFDENMSQVFFDELEIPAPAYNLGVSETGHARMTAQMMVELEQILLDEDPDALLIYGDTNSTLAGALVAAKLHIPVIHIEAGARVGTLDNPEEINRICADHLSTLRFACVESAMEFLEREGLGHNSFLVGDPMYDAFEHYLGKAQATQHQLVDFDDHPVELPEKYYYLTCHREENTGSSEPLQQILSAMNSLDAPTIYPVHPRNKRQALELRDSGSFSNIHFIPAFGYLTSLKVLSGAHKVVTDSGGVQREAFFAKIPCVTVFDQVIWPETMRGNCNQLARADKDDILSRLSVEPEWDESYAPFGSGDASGTIAQILHEKLGS